jgi:translation elongation factor EF-Tu-like GTPase
MCAVKATQTKMLTSAASSHVAVVRSAKLQLPGWGQMFSTALKGCAHRVAPLAMNYSLEDDNESTVKISKFKLVLDSVKAQISGFSSSQCHMLMCSLHAFLDAAQRCTSACILLEVEHTELVMQEFQKALGAVQRGIIGPRAKKELNDIFGKDSGGASRGDSVLKLFR